MAEPRKIKRNGNSLCVALDRGTLKNVYGLEEDDPVEVYYKFPDIIIKPSKIKKN